MPQDRPATMRDVANRAGVSRSLVSTVFRGVPGASPENRKRILDAASDLGYRPDVRARQLRSLDQRVIGVTLTAVHPFHVQVVEALHEAAELRGYELSIGLNTDSRTLERAVDPLLAQRCAALILIGPTVPDDEVARLAESAGGIPVVIVDRHIDRPTLDAVRIDDDTAIGMAVEHLVSLGHRRIWHADGTPYVSAEPRRRAYLIAMERAGLSDQARVFEAGGTARDGAAAAMRLVEHGDLPTAILCYNDRVACGFSDVLWRHRIRVPDDVSLVGFDDIPEASMPHMDLTTVEQRASDLAATAVDVLLHRLEGAPATGLHLMPPGPLIVRGSTARPRARRDVTPMAG